jgi:hypothetical protein
MKRGGGERRSLRKGKTLGSKEDIQKEERIVICY